MVAKIWLSSLMMMAVVGSGVAMGQYTPGSAQDPTSPAWDPGARPLPPVQPSYAPPAYPQAPQAPAYPQTPVYQPVQAAQSVYVPTGQVQAPQLSAQQVDQLTSSIALYPDPLLAIMLPSATYASDVAEAQRWVMGNPNPQEWAIQQLPYQPSVKALVHYPTVLKMMADYPEWTQSLGLAFVYQQGDVVNSIQRWRAAAQNAGNLATTTEQQVVADQGVIQILPAVPETVYVPVYDPGVVYARRNWWDRGPVIRFSVGGRAGNWLDNDWDWRNRQIRVPTRPYWERPDWDARRWDDDRRDRWDDRRNDRWDARPPVVVNPPRWDNNNNNGRRDDKGKWVAPPVRVEPARPTVLPSRPPVNPRVEVRPQPQPQPQRVIGPAPGQANKIDRQVFVRDTIKPGVAYPQKVTPPAGKAFVPQFKMEQPKGVPANGPGKGNGQGNGKR